MHKVNRWMLVTLMGVVPFGSAHATPEAIPGETIQLKSIEAKDALTMVRTLTGTTRVQIADERTLRIESTPDKVRLARKVIELTEGAKAAPESGVQYEVGDGSIVACVALRNASGNAVMAALRTLAIRRIAVVRAPPTALVRGNPEQVKAALAKIRELDREPAPVAPVAPAADSARGQEIQLLRLDAPDAMTLLRSIAGLKEVEIVDGKTLRVRSTPDRVLLARKVIELAEAARGPAEAEGRYDVGDGTVVACATVGKSSRSEVMTALRTLGISRIAVVDEPSTILLRDSEAQVKAALELIRAKSPAAP